MDRHRLVGVGLVLVSAASFGSGALFAKPVYGAGVGWLTLLAWRFLIGASLSWVWLALSSERRAGLRRLPLRRIAIALGLGVLYIGNSGTYYAGPGDGLGVIGRAHRVHLPGDRRGPLAPGGAPPRRAASVGRPGDGVGRDRARARRDPGRRGATAQRARPGDPVADHLRRLDRPVGPAVRRDHRAGRGRGRRRRRHGRRDGADDGRHRVRVLGTGGRDGPTGPAGRSARRGLAGDRRDRARSRPSSRSRRSTPARSGSGRPRRRSSRRSSRSGRSPSPRSCSAKASGRSSWPAVRSSSPGSSSPRRRRRRSGAA